MRWRCLQFLVIPLCVALLSGCDSGPKLATLPADAVILAFGNSLTHGTGAGGGATYPQRLADLTGHVVVNAGVPGEETDAGLARLPGELAESTPALVIIAHGGNDILRRRDLVRTEDNLRQMIALVRRNGAEVLLVGIPKPGLFLSAHPMYRELADELKVPLEARALAEILADAALKSDGIHPNADGYRRLAEALTAKLRETGAIP
jgi:acyl-CoA thioesterase-1